MKPLVLLWLTFVFLSPNQAQETSDKIIGVWLNEDKAHTIEIYKTKDTYYGKIVGISKLESNPELRPKDINNPSPEMRDRDLMGMTIITGLKYYVGKWINGTIYSPKKGLYADLKIELISSRQVKIIVSKSGFTKTEIWTRK